MKKLISEFLKRRKISRTQQLVNKAESVLEELLLHGYSSLELAFIIEELKGKTLESLLAKAECLNSELDYARRAIVILSKDK